MITPADQARFFYSMDSQLPRQSRPSPATCSRTSPPSRAGAIPKVARPLGWKVYFKGGWRGTDSGQLVHQAARLERGQERIAIVVMTDGDPSQGYGIATIKGVAERATEVVATPVRSTRTSPSRFVTPCASANSSSGIACLRDTPRTSRSSAAVSPAGAACSAATQLVARRVDRIEREVEVARHAHDALLGGELAEHLAREPRRRPPPARPARRRPAGRAPRPRPAAARPPRRPPRRRAPRPRPWGGGRAHPR